MHSEEGRRPWRRSLLRLLLIGTIAYTFCVVMLALLQRSLIYFPAQQAEILPEESGLPVGQVQTVRLTSHDGLTLHGWHVLPAGKRAESLEQADRELATDGPVVLYFSGNAGNRSYRGGEVEPLADLGAHVFLFDYRGYGENGGQPNENDLIRDAMTAWQYLTDTRGIAASRIFLFGESLGGGIAVRLGADLCRAGTPPACLILRSTFSSLVDIAAHLYPWMPVRALLLDRFDSVEHIVAVDCPILQIHGQRDTIIPISFARTLFAAAPARSTSGIPKRFAEMPGADHNDIPLVAPSEYRAELEEALMRH